MNKDNFKAASPGKRLLAHLIDGGAWTAILAGLWLWAASAGTIEQLMGALLWMLIILMIGFSLGAMIYTAGMTAVFGGTIGKLLTGIEIVDSAGKRISFWRAFFRNIIGYAVSGMALWLGFIWILVDKERRGWHDMMAETMVVEMGQRPTGRWLGKYRWLMGLAGLIGVIGVIGIMGVKIAGQVKQNLPFYQEIVEDIVANIKPSISE